MNQLATIGHNRSPFELSEEEIEGLCEEARLWLDGAGVRTQVDADGIGKLIDLLRAAIKRADERRKVECEPHDKAKLEIQARYGPLIADNKSQKGKAVLALETCKQALTPWLTRLDEEKRAAAQVAALEADAKATAATQAIRAAKFDDLESRERAEALLKEAERAEIEAKIAAKDKAHAHGGARAIGLRTSYRAEITDPVVFARYCWLNHNVEMLGFLMTIAQRLLDGKQRNLPGVTVHEERKV
jgi:hypothetical protein